MKKFKDLAEQYREEGRFKPVIPHTVKSTGVGPRPQVDSAKTKLKEEVELIDEASKRKLMIGSKVTHPDHGKGTVVMHAQGGGTSGTIVKFAAGKKVKVDYKKLRMSEEVEQLEEGRPSQRHPLEGHEYHKKTNAELEYIAKDAHKAAEAMKGHNTTAENKYRDQANDSATVRYFRQKNGTPDWYKKKYGHMKEESDTTEKTEMAQTQLHFMKYAAEEILEFIEMGGEVEEWYQNKLSKVMSDIESLHSYVEGESRRTGMKEEVAKPKNKPADVTHPEPAANELYVMRQIEKEKAAKKKKGMKEGYEDHHLFPAYMQKILKKHEASPEEKAKNAAKASANKAKPATPQKQEPYKPLGGRDEKSGRSYSEEVEQIEEVNLQESRRANIVREAMEAAKKKNKQQQEQSSDKFNADPVLSSEIVKT